MVFNRHDDEPEFERFSFIGLLLSPYHVIIQFLGDFVDDDSLRVEQTFFQRTMTFLFLPFRMIWGFLAFIVSTWSTSRDGFAFVKSLPVLLVLGTFGVALLLADLISTEGKRLARNRGYIAHHTNNDAPQYCEMFARKLIAIKATDENLYQLGLAYHRNGETEKAYDVMSSLAPDDAPGFSLAHSWMSQHYSNAQKTSQGDETSKALVMKHLDYAIQTDPENQMAHYSMALFHLEESKKYKAGTPEYISARTKAIEEFMEVVNAKTDGITRFQLVSIPKLIELQIEMTEKNDDLKTKLAQEIIRLQPLADIYPNEFDIRLTMVRCATLMEDYRNALRIVREGYDLATDEAVRRKIVGLASMVYLDRASKFDDMTDYEQFRGRIYTLCEAVKANPTEKVVYLKLLDFVGKDPSQEGIINMEWLNDAKTGANAPSIIHCLLGLKELSNGNVLTGERHWRIAEEQFPNAKIVINNMMDVAASERPDQFDNLFDMISFGIEMFQDQPLFYRTRGIYLTSIGKYESAIPDLELASANLENLLDIHQHLITCYEKTNQMSLADEQRQQLESKLSAMNDEERKRMEEMISRITF